MLELVQRKALFLDRDGVINIDRHYVSEIAQFQFVPGIFELCKWAHLKGYLIVVVTNQSGIGRGLFTIERYHSLTNWMLKQFLINGSKIDLVVASPIDPAASGNSAALNYRRKPGPGMIIDACEILPIDLEASILIGDSDSDIEAGIAAGITTVIKIGAQLSEFEMATNFPDILSILTVKEQILK